MPRNGVIMADPILPDTVNEDAVRLKVLNVLGKIAREVHRDFRQTVATWNHKVTFTPGKTFTRGARGREAEYGFRVTTDDAIWGFLNEGTEVRYRRMSFDFESKTEPGTFESFEGRGGPEGFEQRPGIEARGWSEMARQQHERQLYIQVTNAILSGLSNQRLPRRGG